MGVSRDEEEIENIIGGYHILETSNISKITGEKNGSFHWQGES